MSGRETWRNNCILLYTIAQFVKLNHLYFFELVNFQKVNQLSDSWQFSLFEEILFSFPVFVHLGTKTPQEILFRSFDKSCRKVTEFSLHFLFSTLLQYFFAIKNVVFLAISEIWIRFCRLCHHLGISGVSVNWLRQLCRACVFSYRCVKFKNVVLIFHFVEVSICVIFWLLIGVLLREQKLWSVR